VFDIVTVGHFAIDSILLPDRQAPILMLGGSAAYVSLAAKRLESNVAVISKVGGDFPEAYRWLLEQESINTSGLAKVESAQTTHYELRYNSDLSNRTLSLKSRAPPITIDDLPNPLRASVVHLAPIAGEIDYEVAERLKGSAEILSLDSQGLIRSFDNEGNVTHSSTIDKRILELANIYKSSGVEIQAATGIANLDQAIKSVHDYGAKMVIVTLGEKGSVISVEDMIYNVPSCKPERIVDPTGAGDVFMGAFLSEYVHDENILRCGCVGSASASMVIEGVGLTSLGDKETVYKRARELYEKQIKE
jgi:sugar/nucleoside kinase (ribokinase family)